MKRALTALASLLLLSTAASVASAAMDEGASFEGRKVHGGFEIAGYLNTAMGFQHFGRAASTELADDGSFAGPIGEAVPHITLPSMPAGGEDFTEFYVPDVEIDLIKTFGKRARLRADLRFGRLESGSLTMIPAIIHAYCAVTLSQKHALELVVGRFGMPPGFEPYDTYDNDTISWSIIWRGLVAPGSGTGVRLAWSPNDHIDLFLAATNGIIHDWTLKGNNLPTFTASMLLKWGPMARQSTFALTQFVGPETAGDRPITIGTDATLSWWASKRWQLGLEGIFQRDDNDSGPDVNYLGGLMNLHFEPVPSWYTVLKYAFVSQGAYGNFILNLTGSEQKIHEISLGAGHYLTDSAKLKLEARLDVIDPAAAPWQWVAGAALGLSYAF